MGRPGTDRLADGIAPGLVVAPAEAKRVEEARFLAGEPLEEGFDGHANCFIETGFHKALLIDFNYDHEPVSGHYPAAIGLPLLRDSRLNHLGKLLFASIYWHGLLPGREIPGLGSAMPTAGKRVRADRKE